MRHTLLTVALFALCGLSASAQSGTVMGGRTFPPSQRPFFEPNRGTSFIGHSGGRFDGAKSFHRNSRDAFFYGGYPYFPPDYEESYEPVVVSQTQLPVVMPAPPVRQEPVPSAALLELQGNQWVKVNSFSMPNASAAVSTPAKETPPAVLVYRDGHSEELSSYSIIGTTIFAKADYVTTGASTRKIQIADLDLASTLKQNRDRGVRFDLPSGPNEVILRP